VVQAAPGRRLEVPWSVCMITPAMASPPLRTATAIILIARISRRPCLRRWHSVSASTASGWVDTVIPKEEDSTRSSRSGVVIQSITRFTHPWWCYAGYLRTRSTSSVKAYCVTDRLGGRFHETRDSLHDPLAAGGHREFCVALVTCLWTSFANCWNGMCVPI
jgi:hypothetical protein